MTGQLSVRLRPSPSKQRWALSLKASITLIQRLCLFRVCDNIVDATNLNDYVRELSLNFAVKLFVTTAVKQWRNSSQNGGVKLRFWRFLK